MDSARGRCARIHEGVGGRPSGRSRGRKGGRLGLCWMRVNEKSRKKVRCDVLDLVGNMFSSSMRFWMEVIT